MKMFLLSIFLIYNLIINRALKGFKWLLRDCVITTSTLVNIMNSFVPNLFLHLKLDILTFFFPNVIDLENFMDVYIYILLFNNSNFCNRDVLDII